MGNNVDPSRGHQGSTKPGIPSLTTWLWRDTRSSLRLLGSIHYLPVADSLPTWCLAAYHDSSTIVFESRSDALLDQTIGTLPSPLVLKGVLTLYARLDREATNQGVDLFHYRALRPFAIAFTLRNQAEERLGLFAAGGVDSQLLGMANSDAKEVIELEDLNYGFGRIVADGMETEVQYLSMVLDGLPTLREDETRLADIWRTGNVSALEKSHQADMDRYPRVMRILQTERNQNWLPKIEALRHSKTPALVVVGAGHLVGQGSLLALLGANDFVRQ